VPLDRARGQGQPEASVATGAASYFSKANCQFLSNVFVLSSRRRR